MKLYGIRAKDDFTKNWVYLCLIHRDDSWGEIIREQQPQFNGWVSKWTIKRMLRSTTLRTMLLGQKYVMKWILSAIKKAKGFTNIQGEFTHDGSTNYEVTDMEIYSVEIK